MSRSHAYISPEFATTATGLQWQGVKLLKRSGIDTVRTNKASRTGMYLAIPLTLQEPNWGGPNFGCFTPSPPFTDEAHTLRKGVGRKKLWIHFVGRSYGLLLGLGEWCATRRDFSAHGVGVPLTAAARSPEAVIALLAQMEASAGRQVAAQAR